MIAVLLSDAMDRLDVFSLTGLGPRLRAYSVTIHMKPIANGSYPSDTSFDRHGGAASKFHDWSIYYSLLLVAECIWHETLWVCGAHVHTCCTITADTLWSDQVEIVFVIVITDLNCN